MRVYVVESRYFIKACRRSHQWAVRVNYTSHNHHHNLIIQSAQLEEEIVPLHPLVENTNWYILWHQLKFSILFIYLLYICAKV